MHCGVIGDDEDEDDVEGMDDDGFEDFSGCVTVPAPVFVASCCICAVLRFCGWGSSFGPDLPHVSVSSVSCFTVPVTSMAYCCAYLCLRLA